MSQGLLKRWRACKKRFVINCFDFLRCTSANYFPFSSTPRILYIILKDLSSSLLTRLPLKWHSIEREEVKVCKTLGHPQHHRPSVRFNRSNSSKVLEWVSVVQVKNTWPLFSMKHFANFFMPLSPLAARDSLCFVCIVVGRRLVLLQVNSVHQVSSK